MSVHEKFKPFPCTLCEKSFPRAENLRLHTRLVHEKVRLFPCSECDMYFSTKSHAQRHFKKVHESKYFEKVGEEYAEEIEEEDRGKYFSLCPPMLDGTVLENQGRVFLKPKLLAPFLFKNEVLEQ